MAQKKSTIDTGLIRELAEMLNDTNLGEIEVEEGEMRIRVARAGTMASAMPAPVALAPPSPVPVAADTAMGSADSGRGSTSSAAGGTAVPSPMVGTAYMAPAPGAKPFVTEGQKVKEGDTLIIVEAMKTMNQIPAPRDGVVATIEVEDGQPVEFGETLITLE